MSANPPFRPPFMRPPCQIRMVACYRPNFQPIPYYRPPIIQPIPILVQAVPYYYRPPIIVQQNIQQNFQQNIQQNIQENIQEVAPNPHEEESESELADTQPDSIDTFEPISQEKKPWGYLCSLKDQIPTFGKNLQRN